MASRMVPERDRMDSDWVTMRWLSNRTPRSNAPSVTPVAAKNTLSPETKSVVVRIRSKSKPASRMAARSSS